MTRHYSCPKAAFRRVWQCLSTDFNAFRRGCDKLNYRVRRDRRTKVLDALPTAVHQVLTRRSQLVVVCLFLFRVDIRGCGSF